MQSNREELGLDSESLLSEEQNAEGEDQEAREITPNRVHDYKVSARSQNADSRSSPSPDKPQAAVLYDPFEEAQRIAAMIKAECNGQAKKEPAELHIIGSTE